MKAEKVDFRDTIAKLDGSIYNKNFLSNSLSMLYHENSKFTKFEIMEQGVKIRSFSNSFISERSSQPYKAYPACKKFAIKDYEKPDFEADLFKTINKRRSGRIYSEYPISLNEIGKLLYFSYGITGKEQMNDEEHHWHFRAVPSAGALYPLEIYLYLHNGMIPEGLYHYRPDESVIELVEERNNMETLQDIIYAAPVIDITKCSCVMFVTSVFSRILIKYGDRGYRFILQEVGSVMQNTSLLCQALGLSSCMVGSYEDDSVNQFLSVDGTLETIQGIATIGKNETS